MLRITEEQHGKTRILRLIGSLDVQTWLFLKQEIDSLLEKLHFHLLLDLTQVDIVVEEALHFLFSATEKFKKAKGRLGIIGMRDNVLKAMQREGLDQRLLLYASEKEAMMGI